MLPLFRRDKVQCSNLPSPLDLISTRKENDFFPFVLTSYCLLQEWDDYKVNVCKTFIHFCFHCKLWSHCKVEEKEFTNKPSWRANCFAVSTASSLDICQVKSIRRYTWQNKSLQLNMQFRLLIWLKHMDLWEISWCETRN